MHLQVQRVQVCFVAASVLLVAYATTAVQAQQRQAEVIGNNAPRSARFGAKTVNSSANPHTASDVGGQRERVAAVHRRGNSAMPAHARTSRRRYDTAEPPNVQLLAPQNAPTVHKNYAMPPKGVHERVVHINRKGISTTRPPHGRPSSHTVNADGSARYTSRGHSLTIVSDPGVVAVGDAVNGSSSNELAADSHVGSSTYARNRAPASPSAAKSPTRETTTTTTTTTTTRPSYSDNYSSSNSNTNSFSFRNPFNFFPPNFWNLSSPPHQSTLTTTRKPPKKYKPSLSPSVAPTLSAHSSSKEEKLISYNKPKTSAKAVKATATTTTKRPESTEGPFRIALPTFNFFNQKSESHVKDKEKDTDKDKDKGKRATVEFLRENFNCPRESEVRFQLFPKICKVDKDCTVWNREELCCDIFGAKSCVSGIPKPLEEKPHAPILGLIARKCPTRPLAELWWDVKECYTDMDCWPRVCCPDGRRRYCRTSQPELEAAPVPVKRSFNYLTEYLECTPPPPPIFDLHPKACTSTFDCFPNVCCQEAGLRHCRPPKKSVLTLMANFLNVDFVKRLTQNIVIK